MTRQEPSWKAFYYVNGLVAAMGGAFLAFRDGISGFSAVLVLIGGPAVWMWKRDDGLKATLEDLYKQVSAELTERGEREGPVFGGK